jgi:hypothetical protein
MPKPLPNEPDDAEYEQLPPRWDLGAIELGRYPRLPHEELRLLWISGFWDGALSGALIYRGRLRWFEYCGETNYVRRYLVLELSEDEVAEEERWHALFVEHVGSHWDVGDGKTRGEVKPSEEHEKFYAPYGKRQPPDYSRNPILGWFELGESVPSTPRDKGE